MSDTGRLWQSTPEKCLNGLLDKGTIFLTTRMVKGTKWQVLESWTTPSLVLWLSLVLPYFQQSSFSSKLYTKAIIAHAPCSFSLVSVFSTSSLGSDETCQGIHQICSLSQSKMSQSFSPLSNPFEHKICSSKTAKWMNFLNATSRLPFCRLECFSITVGQTLNYWMNFTWNSFSNELKDSLLNVMHSSTWKPLYHMGITHVPIPFFLHDVHLTTLEFHFLSARTHACQCWQGSFNWHRFRFIRIGIVIV